MGCDVLGFQDIDQTQVAVVGGKGAHLGELSRIEGIGVPAGFCVTTNAFQRTMTAVPSIDDRINRLSRLKPDDREAIRTLSAEIRRTLERIAIPDDLEVVVDQTPFDVLGAAEVRFDPPPQLGEPHDLRVLQGRLLLPIRRDRLLVRPA